MVEVVAGATAARLPEFQSAYAPADEALAAAFLAAAPRPPGAEMRIDARARRLIEAIRARTGGIGGVEDFLHAYSLSTREGLALTLDKIIGLPDDASEEEMTAIFDFTDEEKAKSMAFETYLDDTCDYRTSTP